MLNIGAKVEDDKFHIALINEALEYENGSKVPDAIAIVAQMLAKKKSDELIKALQAHYKEIVEILKIAGRADLLCDFIPLIQQMNIDTELFLWIAKGNSDVRILPLLPCLPEENFHESVAPIVLRAVEAQLSQSSTLRQNRLQLLGKYLLRCPPSDLCEKVAKDLKDLSLCFFLLIHGTNINWLLLEEIVKKIAVTKDNVLKRNIELAMRGLPRNSVIACKRVHLLALNMLIELKSPYIITLTQNIAKESETLDKRYLETLLNGIIPLLEKNPLASVQMTCILKKHPYHDLDLLLIEYLLKKYDLTFFKVAVNLFNANYEGLKKEKSPEELVRAMSKFIDFWKTYNTPEVLDPYLNTTHIPDEKRIKLRCHFHDDEPPTIYASPKDYVQLLEKFSLTLLETDPAKNKHFSESLRLCFVGLYHMGITGKDSITYKIVQKQPTSQNWYGYFRSSFEFIGSVESAVTKLELFSKHYKEFSEKDFLDMSEEVHENV